MSDNDHDESGDVTPFDPHPADGIESATTPLGPPGAEGPRSRPGRRRRLVVGLAVATVAVTTVAAGLAVANDKPKNASTTQEAQRSQATEPTKPTATTLPTVASEPDDTPAIDEIAISAFREVPLVSPAEISGGLQAGVRRGAGPPRGGRLPRGRPPLREPSASAVSGDGSLGLDLELTISLPGCRTDLGGEEDNLPYTAGKYRGSFERSDPVDEPGRQHPGRTTTTPSCT